MLFSQILGQASVKQKLIRSVREARISHAQLFLGAEGSGALPLAIAYAQYIACTNKSDSDSCGTCTSCKQFAKLSHPDTHFLFPQIVKKKEEEKGRGVHLAAFREAFVENPYLTLSDWFESAELDNKQGIINVEDVAELNRKLSLRSFLGGYKIAIIWLPEKMHASASNKMLKIFEEPPDKTLFILVSENSESLLPTVLSRMQLIKVGKLSDEEIFQFLHEKKELEFHAAKSISRVADGNFSEALKFTQSSNREEQVMKIRDWFLLCHGFRKNTAELLKWTDKMAAEEREDQKIFLAGAMYVFRESFLISGGTESLVRLEGQELGFARKFSRLIHPDNAEKIFGNMSEAHYHLERNAYSKLLFLDLSFRLGTLLNPKP